LGYRELVERQDEIVADAIKIYTDKYGPIQMDPREIQSVISYTKNRGGYVMPNGMDTMIDSRTPIDLGIEPSIIANLLVSYEKAKGSMVDFDDQLAIPAKLFRMYQAGLYESNPYAMFKRIQFLFLDELQD